MAVAAAITNALNLPEPTEKLLHRYEKISKHPTNHWCEFLAGRAGIIFGGLWLNSEFQKEVVPASLIKHVAMEVVNVCSSYTKAYRQPANCLLMCEYHGSEYLGAAHGITGILQAIIQV